MNRILFTAATIIVFTITCQAQSQSQELPKFEVAAEFTTLERNDFTGTRTDPGFGGRFTFNFNRVVSFETAGYFFPKRCFSCRDNGRITEVLAGVKVGKYTFRSFPLPGHPEQRFAMFAYPWDLPDNVNPMVFARNMAGTEATGAVAGTVT